MGRNQTAFFSLEPLLFLLPFSLVEVTIYSVTDVCFIIICLVHHQYYFKVLDLLKFNLIYLWFIDCLGNWRLRALHHCTSLSYQACSSPVLLRQPESSTKYSGTAMVLVQVMRYSLMKWVCRLLTCSNIISL